MVTPNDEEKKGVVDEELPQLGEPTEEESSETPEYVSQSVFDEKLGLLDTKMNSLLELKDLMFTPAGPAALEQPGAEPAQEEVDLEGMSRADFLKLVREDTIKGARQVVGDAVTHVDQSSRVNADIQRQISTVRGGDPELYDVLDGGKFLIGASMQLDAEGRGGKATVQDVVELADRQAESFVRAYVRAKQRVREADETHNERPGGGAPRSSLTKDFTNLHDASKIALENLGGIEALNRYEDDEGGIPLD
jgi:hypothetical protein